MLLILGGRAMVDFGGVETRKKEFYSTILSESRGPALPDKLLMISDYLYWSGSLLFGSVDPAIPYVVTLEPRGWF